MYEIRNFFRLCCSKRNLRYLNVGNRGLHCALPYLTSGLRQAPKGLLRQGTFDQGGTARHEGEAPLGNGGLATRAEAARVVYAVGVVLKFCTART